jgi:hypothetical protein
VYSIKEGWDYGDVVILNSKEYEGTEIALTEIPCHADAYGVISREWAFLIGGEVDATHAPVALMGKVHVNVVGGCVKGDYLVTSNISGVAKAIKTKAEAPLGGIFARAMESKSTVGVAPVLCAIWRC